ncbi:hypothetical protein RFI_27070, partial [Reticulomyxa filosa]
DAIQILHKHERREESEMELYCGLKGVRFENIEKEIKSGFFISHVSTSDDIRVAKMYRSDQGCILHFHSSMIRSSKIPSCDVSWISPFEHEREILFARSMISPANNEKTHKEQYAWNAKVESEDGYTQMILLTWTPYDQCIQQIIQISAIWNHKIDFNLIYVALSYECEGDIKKTFELLSEFEKWKFRDNNQQKYKEKENEFVNKRCCNHNVNLFCIFLSDKYKGQTAVEHAKINTIQNCLPFTKKDKDNVLNRLYFISKRKVTTAQKTSKQFFMVNQYKALFQILNRNKDKGKRKLEKTENFSCLIDVLIKTILLSPKPCIGNRIQRQANIHHGKYVLCFGVQLHSTNVVFLE